MRPRRSAGGDRGLDCRSGVLTCSLRNEGQDALGSTHDRAGGLGDGGGPGEAVQADRGVPKGGHDHCESALTKADFKLRSRHTVLSRPRVDPWITVARDDSKLSPVVGCTDSAVGASSSLRWTFGRQERRSPRDPKSSLSSRSIRFRRLAGVALRACRRTMSGTSSCPIPVPSKSSSIVTRDRASPLRRSTVTLTTDLIGPSTRRIAQRPGRFGLCHR